MPDETVSGVQTYLHNRVQLRVTNAHDGAQTASNPSERRQNEGKCYFLRIRKAVDHPETVTRCGILVNIVILDPDKPCKMNVASSQMTGQSLVSLHTNHLTGTCVISPHEESQRSRISRIIQYRVARFNLPHPIVCTSGPSILCNPRIYR